MKISLKAFKKLLLLTGAPDEDDDYEYKYPIDNFVFYNHSSKRYYYSTAADPFVKSKNPDEVIISVFKAGALSDIEWNGK